MPGRFGIVTVRDGDHSGGKGFEPVFSFGLLIVFVLCGLVYSRASKEMSRLDKLRLDREPPDAPSAVLGAATEFMRKMGLPMAAGGDELKAFCDKNGLGAEYARINRQLLGSIAVAASCMVVIIWLGSPKR